MTTAAAGKRILVVEDERALRQASEIALTRQGYTVLAASGGLEGLELARKELPDLILLDLLMPAPTGLDVLRTLRAEEWGRSIPVLVVSNSLLQRVVDEVRALGAEYIVKADVSLKEICLRVAATLARHAATPAG